ncbi:hypothetical protein JOC95_002146 [Bacillus tianshenii]|uniref:Uncharacterized protein n=1 Tax=Sutcliffiella tianshenii TaxID=1463404 RepID=A0ABS2P116_9BACI|nr:hypothetical protein [Bacillus tianshenii]MBM7620293.1 hypothetical protein [Bacillus tianshenii]MCA1318911.1 hypothetical protein [Bacillus tianshenii]
MDRQRKDTIIREIKYWKESRMLPEHYCDYLLALYTEGEGSNKREKAPKKNLLHLFLAILIPMFVPITFLVIYFTELSIDLQMLPIIFFILLSLLGYYVFRKEHFFIHIPVITIALLVLLLSLKLVEATGYDSTRMLAAVGVQAIGWFVMGVLKKWYYMNAAAIITVILIAGVIILK